MEKQRSIQCRLLFKPDGMTTSNLRVLFELKQKGLRVDSINGSLPSDLRPDDAVVVLYVMEEQGPFYGPSDPMPELGSVSVVRYVGLGEGEQLTKKFLLSQLSGERHEKNP